MPYSAAFPSGVRSNVYAPPDGAKVAWDAKGQVEAQIRVEASYVIIRGMTLRNAQASAIELGDVQKVVVEDCEISGWGRVNASDGFGDSRAAVVADERFRLRHVHRSGAGGGGGRVARHQGGASV